MEEADDQFEQLAKAQAGVDALVGLLDGNSAATFGDVARNVSETGLFAIPDLLKMALVGADVEVDDDEEKGRTDRDSMTPY